MDEYSSSQSNSNGSSYALMSDMPPGGRVSEPEDELGKDESHRQLYSCRVCDAEFAEMRTLKIHTRTHTETELREAGVITSSSPEKSASPGLDSSGIDSPASPMSKSLQIESLKCDVCHEIFTTTAALARHSQGHNIEKPYRCDQCGATFSLPGTLTVHKRVHTNDRPYKCSSCGASFNQRSTFKTHLRVHTGERPYSCDLCDKSFSDVSTLKKHRRIHTGERPYECEMCGRAFTQAGNLQRHRRNHNLHPGGVQKCHVCSEFFEDLPSLKAHLKVHSSEMAVSCKPCNASLSYLCNLQKKHRLAKDVANTGISKCDVCNMTTYVCKNLTSYHEFHSASDLDIENIQPQAVNTAPVEHIEQAIDETIQKSEEEAMELTPSMPDSPSEDRPVAEKRNFSLPNILPRAAKERRKNSHPQKFERSTEPPPVTIPTIPPPLVPASLGVPLPLAIQPSPTAPLSSPMYSAPLLVQALDLSMRPDTAPSAMVEPRGQSQKYFCPVCNIPYPSLTALQYHQSSNGHHCCEVCEQLFFSRKELHQHRMEHQQLASVKTMSKCKECGVTFADEAKLQRHVKTHKTRFICAMCGKAFTRHLSLQVHREQKHPEGNTFVRCKDIEFSISGCDIRLFIQGEPLVSTSMRNPSDAMM